VNTRKILKKIEFRPKKRLGQNFLQDEEVLNSIIAHSQLKPTDTVLEIGAGLGVLTERLVNEAGKVISLEVDPVLHHFLSNKFGDNKNVQILLQDVLKYDARGISEKKVKVIANLPYYISTPILMHLIKSIEQFSMILIMLQKELAERITAGPGTKRYGSLSIALQYYTETEIVAVVPKTAFYPEPDVDSALIRLQVLEHPRVDVQDPEKFFNVVRSAFSQRRKTLRNSLLGSGQFSARRLNAAFETTGISPTRRAETLSIHEFAELAHFLI
jgi:16S rRNA (adenine1518-N6/adenine1519-N6)-dimethyltransferase